MKKILVPAALLISLFFSCTKDEDIIAPEPPGGDTTIIPPPSTFTDSARSFIQSARFNNNGIGTGEFTCYNADLSVKWMRTGLGNATEAAIYDKGTFYLSSYYFQSDPGTGTNVGYDNFFAIDAQTGTTKWSLINTGRKLINQAVRNDTIFCGANSSTNKNYIMAIDAKTGATFWDVMLTDRYAPYAPAMRGNMIYFFSAVSDSDPTIWINAFDINTKTIKWKLSTGAYFAISLSKLIFEGNKGFYRSAAGTIKAFDLETGNVIWQRTGQYTQPFFAAGKVFTTTQDHTDFTGFNINTGATDITFDPGIFMSSSGICAADGDDIFITGINPNTNVPAITSVNGRTGATNWKRNTTGWAEYLFVIGKYVYEFRQSNVLNNNANALFTIYNRVNGVLKDSLQMQPNRVFGMMGGFNKNNELISAGTTKPGF